MFGPGLVVSALAAAVVAWGVPPAAVPPEPPHMSSVFETDPDAPVDGKIAREAISGVIRRHVDEVKACYERELSAQPTLAGRIDVEFTIGASGQVVTSALVRSTIGNARFEACTLEAVRRWHFPKPRGGGIVIVNYPFTFTPEVVPSTVKLVAGTNGGGQVEIESVVAPTLYVHRSSDAKAVPSNGLVAVMAGGLLLVDTAWTETQTEAVLKWGDDYLKRPWIGAVITHDHGDRAGGLAALERRHIPIAAVDLTVAKMTKRGVRGVTTLFLARDGGHKDPRGFEAFYPGPGHAPDNIVLRFPGLLYGGCLVKSTAADDLGFTGDADLAAWPAAIHGILNRYRETTIVPGHGPVDRSGEALEHTLDLLAAAGGKKWPAAR